MISFEQFDRYINILRKDNDFINRATDLLHTDFFFENYQSIGLASDLLGIMMHDEDDWLGWWLWECDFGTRDITDSVIDDNGTPIPLRTTRELYDFLCENAANKEAKCD